MTVLTGTSLAALTWIKTEYLELRDNEDISVHAHVTDATNTENVKFVWATLQIILENKLNDMGA